MVEQDLNETIPWEKRNFKITWIHGVAICAFHIQEIKVVTSCLHRMTRYLCGQTEWWTKDSTAGLQHRHVDESAMPQQTPILLVALNPDTSLAVHKLKS